MSLMSLSDLYVAELADLHDAEDQAMRLLTRLADLAHAPELKELLAQHYQESRLHLERLQLIFTRLGEHEPDSRCAGVAGIVQEADERLNEPATPDARDAGIIGMVQRLEHYEIAAYGCARSYARRLNRPDEARLLQETLEDERRVDRRLTEMADAHINDDARSEADLHHGDLPRRLRYIDVRQLDYSRLTRGPLAVKNDADEDLGTFDGVVVDAADDRPRYVVVAAPGVFARRRYMLPVAPVRFDHSARVLRVDLDRRVADRYPPFEPDEFQAMSDDALRGYEARLFSYFARDDRQRDRMEHYAEPEWLMTGVWIPLPSDRAAGLTDQARSFANEFLPNREQAVGRSTEADATGMPAEPRDRDPQVNPRNRPGSEQEGGERTR